jgi:tRNA/tmRNA/rRNA uracil-C5-methylase (TrmA/RlmC/RlmD family)
MIPSPQIFSYRGRAEVHVQFGGGCETKAGFMERGSHVLLDVQRCLLMAESVNDALSGLRRSLDVRKDGPVRRVERLLWSSLPDERTTDREKAAPPPEGCLLRAVKGDTLSVPVRGFFQANEGLVDTLVDVVLELASPSPRMRCWMPTAARAFFPGSWRNGPAPFSESSMTGRPLPVPGKTCRGRAFATLPSMGARWLRDCGIL